ncbi:MAG TPA: helix-turn-helix domain-containing protein [Syntrophomonadaceae bacterium]|nr:helix-turn-helix domain-containing protein [Syntrophomonadaceae bacterium]
MSIGEILREAREKKGLSLSDVENETKIRTKYLAALESEDFKEIPGEAYVLGFLRNYARFLELDADQIVNSYKSQIKTSDTVTSPPCQEESQPSPETDEGLLSGALSKRKGLSLIITSIVVVMLIILAIIFGFLKGDTSRTPEPPNRFQSQVTNTNIKTQKPQLIKIELIATEKCWVRVTADGIEKFAGMLYPGMIQKYQAKNSITLRLGNAGGVQVIYNGKKLPPLGQHGDVVDKEFRKSG